MVHSNLPVGPGRKGFWLGSLRPKPTGCELAKALGTTSIDTRIEPALPTLPLVALAIVFTVNLS